MGLARPPGSKPSPFAEETRPGTPLSLLREHAALLSRHTGRRVLAEVRQNDEGIVAYRLVVPSLDNQRLVLFELAFDDPEAGDQYPLRVKSAPGKLATRVRSGRTLLRNSRGLEAFLEAVFAERETQSRLNGLIAEAL